MTDEGARLATTKDVELIVALAVRHRSDIAGQRGADLLLRREYPISGAEHAERLHRALAAPDEVVIAGTYDGLVFGYARMEFETLVDGDVLARIRELVVDPAVREVGIGEAMMNLLVEQAEKRGCVGIDAIALPGDRETKNFFESFGLKARQLIVHRSLDNGSG